MTVIRGYQEVFSPRVFLKANDAFAVDLLDHMESFEFSEEDKKPNELRIVTANPGLKFSDDQRLAEGVNFTVRWGYAGDFSETKYVSIAKVDAPASGNPPKLTMVAWDVRMAMNKEARPRNWGPLSSSQIAEKIAAAWGLKTSIEWSDDLRQKDRIQPANTTDIQFLQQLAESINFDVYIDGNVLHYHPLLLKKPAKLIFEYFTDWTGTLKEFKPTVKMSKPGSVGVSGANAQKGTSKSESSSSNDGPVAGGYVVSKASGAVTGTFVGPPGVRVPAGGSSLKNPSAESDVLRGQAFGAKQKIDMKTVEATATVIGTPRLKARDMIWIEGVPKTHSGAWRVQSVKHKITKDSYLCELKLSRNGIGKGSNAASNANNKKPSDNNSNGSNGGGVNVSKATGEVFTPPK